MCKFIRKLFKRKPKEEVRAVPVTAEPRKTMTSEESNLNLAMCLDMAITAGCFKKRYKALQDFIVTTGLDVYNSDTRVKLNELVDEEITPAMKKLVRVMDSRFITPTCPELTEFMDRVRKMA